MQTRRANRWIMAAELELQPATWSLHFSPNGDATDALIRAIDGETRALWFMVYQFTSPRLADALIAAKGRGVVVQGLFDRSQVRQKSSTLRRLCESGITTYVDDKHAIAHNKVLLCIDSCVVATGSMNWTKGGQTANAENVLMVRNEPHILGAYMTEWRHHREHSTLYEARPAESQARFWERMARQKQVREEEQV